jgi:hypothetical protein
MFWVQKCFWQFQKIEQILRTLLQIHNHSGSSFEPCESHNWILQCLRIIHPSFFRVLEGVHAILLALAYDLPWTHDN